MYTLERRVFLKTGRCLRYCWQRYAVSANRPLLEKVRAGQLCPDDWRVVPTASAAAGGGPFASSDRPAA